MSRTLFRGLDERISEPAPDRWYTREEALDLLHRRIDGVRVPDRHPGMEPIVLSVDPDSLHVENAYGWRANVLVSHEPCAGIYLEVDEELAILSETMLWDDGFNVFLMPEYVPPTE